MPRRKKNNRGRLRGGVARVEAALLLPVLHHIATHGGVAEPEIREISGLSRASNIRLLANARAQYGVVVRWRHDNSLPSRGEYSIEDWGVFDPIRVEDWIKRRRN